MICSVAYRYSKSMSIIERVLYIYMYIYIYIEFLAAYIRDPSRCCLSKFIAWAIIEELSIRRRVQAFLISWGQKTCEKQLFWFIVVLWVLVCKNMYRYERHFGSFHRYSSLPMFPIAQSNLLKLAVGAAQRHHSWNAYLTSMFGHYIGGYIINSISERLQRYVDKMALITTLPSNPREGTKAVIFPSDSYAPRWIIQKVDPKYNLTWKVKPNQSQKQ